jgi:Glycosyl hydrolase family 63 C-terminal domain
MPMVTEDDRALIRAESGRVLALNWREGSRDDGVPFAYTCPSPGHYPWQFYWDSCFTAIVWRHFDPERARRELESLLNASRADGFIGHTIFWNTPLRGVRRFTYNVTSPHAPMTASIQPPLLAWAWSLSVGDPALEPRIGKHHDWLEAHRDLKGDGLIWIVQPDESGIDASPQFDPIWRWRAHALPGFVTLVHRNRRLGYDIGRIAAAGGPVVCEPVTNVLYSLSRVALGRPSLTQALIDRCYDERTGLFHSVWEPRARDAPQPPVTWASLAPLALPDLPEGIGRRLVEEHLLDPSRFWLPSGTPTVAADQPCFQRGDKGPFDQHRYWRGPMWVNASWLLWLGLIRLGYTEQAAELATRVVGTVRDRGLHEYYDPVSGTGMGQHPFGWSALALELFDAPKSASTGVN